MTFTTDTEQISENTPAVPSSPPSGSERSARVVVGWVAVGLALVVTLVLAVVALRSTGSSTATKDVPAPSAQSPLGTTYSADAAERWLTSERVPGSADAAERWLTPDDAD
jgi:hypothetical protein